jgi:hypothetical protein
LSIGHNLAAGLDWAGARLSLPLMIAAKRLRLLWLAGLAMLAVAHVTHAYEHWEIAAHHDCVAHTHADGDHDEGDPRHDHGCTSHDHAPALAGGIFVLTVTETVATVSGAYSSSALPRITSIDHPPQLS